MDFTSIASVFHWLIAHGYLLMFVVMFVEGPIATTAAAFAVSQGYFSIPAVFVISILGDMVADAVYYGAGYGLQVSVVERFGRRIKLPESRIQKIHNLIRAHTVKTIVALKFTPIVPVFGFMLMGAMRISLGRFLLTCLVVSLGKTTLFMAVGYYFGSLYHLGLYVKYGDLALFAAVVIFIGLYFAYKKFFAWLGNKIEKV